MGGYEADQRHADLIIQETGASKLSALSHPGGEKKVIEEEEQSEEFHGKEATRFRAVAARANYLCKQIDLTSSMQLRRFAGGWQNQW